MTARWLVACVLALCSPVVMAEDRINFVVIFCDDLGYGDLACYGHPTIHTPNLDRMAEEGQKWTSFYSAAPVCTPSRASLLTGRLPLRSGMTSNRRRVLFPNSTGGLPSEEVTIAEALGAAGYATGHFGKWHLGHLPEYLPTRHGFDAYYGIPYSNDMMWAGKDVKRSEAFADPKSEYWNVPLMRGEEIIEQPAEQSTITKRYTDEASSFIRAHADEPFFVYLAHSMPHVPLFRSEDFAGRSRRGMYGDVIEEIDASVGSILQVLEEEGLAGNTVVLFTSDNGPWLPYKAQGGSAGLLRGGKGSTWEGGMRVPGIFWGPGTVSPGIVRDMGSTLDVLPTFLHLAGEQTPEDRVMDGIDLGPLLKGEAGEVGPREIMFFYRDEDLYAVRMGRYKAHFQTRDGYGAKPLELGDAPLLFDLEVDPGEQYDVAARHPEIIGEIRMAVERHRSGLKSVPNQLDRRKDPKPAE